MDITPIKEQTPTDRIIRVSFAWVLLATFAIVVLGAIGGFLAQWWWQPAVPLPETQDRLVTTIQEVTISPSTAIAELVRSHERSVVLLASQQGQARPSPVATGFVVTSDGVVVTTASLPQGDLVMIDGEGRHTPLERVGQDVVYGLTYVRASRGVFSPVDMRDTDVPVGSLLTTVSRNSETLFPSMRLLLAEEYRLPERGDPVGWQRLLGAAELTEQLQAGSPLLDDEGRVAALVIPNTPGRLLPGVFLRRSLERVARGQLEQNPIAEKGLALDYAFVMNADGVQEFRVVVEAVTPRSSAAAQGIRGEDMITAIGGQPLTWETDVVAAFAPASLPLALARESETRNVTLLPTPVPSGQP